jgi:hypothetical protein
MGGPVNRSHFFVLRPSIDNRLRCTVGLATVMNGASQPQVRSEPKRLHRNIPGVSVSFSVAGCLMKMYSPPQKSRQRATLSRTGLLQLGWPHFWLLIGILGMGLSLLVFVLLVRFGSS